MGKDIVLGEDWLITLSVIYGLGAVLSVWATLLSPMLLDIWDTPQGQKKKTDRDWLNFSTYAFAYLAPVPTCEIIITLRK